MEARHLAAAGMLAAVCLPSFAQSLKPGLWEITNKMSGNSQMDQAMAEMQKQMASMPPAERMKMEEMYAKRGMKMGGGPGGGMSVKTCITREMVERQDIPGTQQKGDCKTTVQQRDGKTIKTAYSCTTPPSSGEGEMTFVSSEAYTSKMKISSSLSGKPDMMTIEGAGKWLGADCGSVKSPAVPAAPVAPPKR